MLNLSKLFTFILFTTLFTVSAPAFSQYHKTLPKGVRAFDLRSIRTGKIDSSYNHSKSESPYSYDIELDSNTLKSIDNDVVQTIFEVLEPYPNAAKALNLGRYNLEAQANIEVDVIGLGWGITNRLTAYAGLPIYKANVRMKYNRPQGNNYNKVSEILENETEDDFAQGIGGGLEDYGQNLDIDGSFLQNLVVNHFNYNEVGDWQGEGPGDAEFGIMWNFLKTDNYGLLLTLGAIAPTGRVDDPDIIQDIGFGDGQWDAFVEFGLGARIFSWLNVNNWFRYTHQLASEKDLRVPYSEDVFIGDQKATFTEKLGDEFLYHISADLLMNDWVSFNAAYEYTHTDEASYRARDNQFAYAQQILASNTESSQHNFRISAELSSLTPFMKKEFLLPASIKFSYQKMLDGQNIAKADRYELAFRMFF